MEPLGSAEPTLGNSALMHCTVVLQLADAVPLEQSAVEEFILGDENVSDCCHTFKILLVSALMYMIHSFLWNYSFDTSCFKKILFLLSSMILLQAFLKPMEIEVLHFIIKKWQM